MVKLDEVWACGEWDGRDEVAHYRAEWLGEKLVERVSFRAAARPYSDDGPLAGATWAGKIVELVRFWLAADDQVVDKSFDADGDVLGYYSPVTRPMERRGEIVRTRPLILGLRMDADGRVTVTGEAAFDAAVGAGDLTPVESEHAEHRIRQLTAASAAGTWPPPFVRNFQLAQDVRAQTNK